MKSETFRSVVIKYKEASMFEEVLKTNTLCNLIIQLICNMMNTAL